MNRKQLKEHILKQLELGNNQIIFDYTYYGLVPNAIDNRITVEVDLIFGFGRFGFGREAVYKLVYDNMDSYKHDYEKSSDSSAYDSFISGWYSGYRGFSVTELDKLVAFIYYNFRNLKARR